MGNAASGEEFRTNRGNAATGPDSDRAKKDVMVRKQSTSGRVGIIVLVAVGILGVAAYRSADWLPGKAHKEYEIVEGSLRDICSTVQATGIVKPKVGADVKVGARTPGKVVELPINVGDKVEQGQVIARLEQEDLVAKVKLQRALLAEARAEEKRLKRDWERDKQLSQTSSISSQQLDKSEALYEMAQARTEKYAAELDYHEAQLSYATIVAPIKGVVASVNTIQGETVVTGLNAPTFIEIVDLDHLEVLAYVDENDVGKVRVDAEATFTVAAHPTTEFRGTVTSIYPAATTQDNVVYYKTSISVDNRERMLRPDMTANVEIVVDRRAGVVAVPHKAVKRESGQRFVLVLKTDKPEKRVVEVGSKDHTHTEIRDGLSAGDRVVVGEVGRK
jgi:RND family efflux transporter MFP subunit